jgi:gamma-tubulin complex component 2
MDIAEEELEKQNKFVSIEKLESLLEMALRTSSANSDIFKDDVSADLENYTLLE